MGISLTLANPLCNHDLIVLMQLGSRSFRLWLSQLRRNVICSILKTNKKYKLLKHIVSVYFCMCILIDLKQDSPF